MEAKVMTFSQWDSRASRLYHKCLKQYHQSLTSGSISNRLNPSVIEVREKTIVVNMDKFRELSQEVIDYAQSMNCVQKDVEE